MRTEQSETVEQLASMHENLRETKAKNYDREAKAAEDLQSERGAYVTLKKNLSKTIDDLEMDLENTKKSL